MVLPGLVLRRKTTISLTCHITGGASGIGLAAARLLLEKGATVHIVDIRDPDEDNDTWKKWERFHVHKADVRNWTKLRAVFGAVGACDFVFANAGAATGDHEFLEDNYDDEGNLAEPQYGDLLTNAHGCMNTIKLAWHNMRTHKRAGSIVITTGDPDGKGRLSGAWMTGSTIQYLQLWIPLEHLKFTLKR